MLASELAQTAVTFTRNGNLFVYVPHDRGRKLRELGPMARQVDDLGDLLAEIRDTEAGFIASRNPVPWPVVQQRRIVEDAFNESRSRLDGLVAQAKALPGPESLTLSDELLARQSLRSLEQTVKALPPKEDGYVFVVGLDPEMMIDPAKPSEVVPGLGTLTINPTAMVGESLDEVVVGP